MPIPELPIQQIIMNKDTLKVTFDVNQKSVVKGWEYTLNSKSPDVKEAELVYQVHQAVHYLIKYFEDRG